MIHTEGALTPYPQEARPQSLTEEIDLQIDALERRLSALKDLKSNLALNPGVQEVLDAISKLGIGNGVRF